MMYAAGHPYNLLTSAEVDLIFQTALRILAEMGIEIQNQQLLQVMADFGLPVDFRAGRVRFPPAFVEGFIEGAEKHDWEQTPPRVSATAGVYHGLYHDPVTGKLSSWSEENLAFYFAVARSLSNVGQASMLGCRLPVPGPLEPLYERYYCWKYGAAEGGSIYLDKLCPYLLDLYRALADESGRPLADVFKGNVYLLPALKLGRHEAYQVAFFRERGLRVNIGGSMLTMGASAPVTLAGAVSLNLAEQLALRILDWAFFGRKRWHIHASISLLDMKTTIRPFGRPEMAIANLMTAQIARHFGASFDGHAGLSDAKLPSAEAGAQKALTAVSTLLVGGSVWLDAGLLSIDEIYSPVQMILDNELLSALKRFTAEFCITAETLALETILEAGPGGNYLDKLHTARHFRREHWNPEIWSRQRTQTWIDEGCRLDADKARQIALEVQNHPPASPPMSEALEREVLTLIERARASL